MSIWLGLSSWIYIFLSKLACTLQRLNNSLCVYTSFKFSSHYNGQYLNPRALDFNLTSSTIELTHHISFTNFKKASFSSAKYMHKVLMSFRVLICTPSSLSLFRSLYVFVPLCVCLSLCPSLSLKFFDVYSLAA